MNAINSKRNVILLIIVCFAIAGIIVLAGVNRSSVEKTVNDEDKSTNGEDKFDKLLKAKEELQKDPNNWILLERLGTYSFLSNDMSAAEEAFLKALEHAPKSKSKRFAMWRLCRVYGTIGDSDKYFEMLDRLIATKETTPMDIGVNLLEWFYVKPGQDRMQALDSLMNNFEDQYDSGTLDLYGACLLNYSYVLKIHPLRFGEKLGEIKQASPEELQSIAEYSNKRCRILEKACEFKPELAVFQLELAEAYLEADKLDMCAEAAEEAKNLDPNSETVHHKLLDLYYQKARADREISVDTAKISAQKAKDSGEFLLTILEDEDRIQRMQEQLQRIEDEFFSGQLRRGRSRGRRRGAASRRSR